MKPDYPSAGAYASAAARLGCEEAAIRAVASVEAGRFGAFLDSGEPVLLYERHLFHGLTQGRFDPVVLDGEPISDRRSGGYGAAGAHQHRRLQAAVACDREAALKSCSWGLFQILGLNHVSAGHPTLQGFIDAMYRSADDHLEAFVRFIKYNPRLVAALREKCWVDFAYGYNGPQHAKHDYAGRMATVYAHLSESKGTEV